MILPLRDWQELAVPIAVSALEAKEAGVIAACTGSGKSVALAETVRRWRLTHPPEEGAIVVTTPTQALVRQLHGTLSSMLGASAVGAYYTKAKDHHRPVVVCCNPSATDLARQFLEVGRPVSVWIADECHREIGLDGEDIEIGAGVFPGARRLGFSATPYLASASKKLSLYDRVLFTYSVSDALRDKVIVPVEVVHEDERDGVEVDGWIADAILRMGARNQRGPGAIDADNIEDATKYAAFLDARGIRADVIHSRQKGTSRDEALDRLYRGVIDCVVHVSMLVEGVDLPWLRWIALRRRVESRVRFVQTIGRGIRAYAGKTSCVLLDPHDLWGEFAPSYPAALGWPDPEAEARAVALIVETEEKATRKEAGPPEVVYAARVGAIARYVRSLRNALAADGTAVNAKRPVGVRTEPPTPKQLSMIARMGPVAVRIGSVHREVVGRILGKPAVLTLGSAGDLIDFLGSLRKQPRRTKWEPVAVIPPPPAAAWEVVQHQDTRMYVAVALKGQRVAAAWVCGGQVATGCRAKNEREGRGAALEGAVRVAVEKMRAREVCVSMPAVAASQDLFWRERATVRCVEAKHNPAEGRAWKAWYAGEKKEVPA